MRLRSNKRQRSCNTTRTCVRRLETYARLRLLLPKVNAVDASETPQRYVFLVLLRNSSDANMLSQLLPKLIADSRDIDVSFVRPGGWDGHPGALNSIRDWFEDVPKTKKIIILIEHDDELPLLLSTLQLNADIYV